MPAPKEFGHVKLSNTSNALVCALLAGIPLGYQWHSLAKLRDANEQLQQQIAAARAEADSAERTTRGSGEQAPAESAGQPLPTATRSAPPVAADSTQGRYQWDESSPYVRLPKSLLSSLRFGTFATRVGADGKVQRYQLPALSADGTPQPVLEAVLGLSATEADQLRSACRATFASFQDTLTKHSELAEAPFLNGKSVELKTSAFADEGGALQQQFRTALTAILGDDRTSAFWQQAQSVFGYSLNDFGSLPHDVKLISIPGQPLLVHDTFMGATRSQFLDDMMGRSLPPALQSYVNSWGNGAQPSSSGSQR